ncbi:MAG: hypothetical protein J7L55_04255 [Desulfurococcales archaeon]|nr:hypothetical protein [Desulfurococcales archaeon]
MGFFVRYVGIAAYSGDPPQTLIYAAQEFVWKLRKHLPSKNTVLVLGGYWGLMRVIVDEALKAGFKVVILPPESMEDVSFPDNAIVIRTGTSFRVRSVFLVRTADVLVALGGEAGSIQEVVTAYTEGKPIYVLGGTGFSTDRVKSLAPYIDRRMTSEIHIINDPSTLAEAVAKELLRRLQ